MTEEVKRIFSLGGEAVALDMIHEVNAYCTNAHRLIEKAAFDSIFLHRLFSRLPSFIDPLT